MCWEEGWGVDEIYSYFQDHGKLPLLKIAALVAGATCWLHQTHFSSFFLAESLILLMAAMYVVKNHIHKKQLLKFLCVLELLCILTVTIVI